MRFKVVGGTLDLEPAEDVYSSISDKLKAIADAEAKKKKKESAKGNFMPKEEAVKSHRDIETLARPGDPEHFHKEK